MAKKPFKKTDPDQVQKAIGKKIQALRKATGMSAEGFAREVGMSRTQMLDIEKGVTNLGVKTLTRILNGLNTTLAEFFAEGI